MTRKDRILLGLDVANGKGLEIGPLSRPILSKKEANIFYADHVSTGDLRKKYKNEPIELNDIVEVDYVLSKKNPLSSLGTNTFDYVIAAHVIEHIPDVISWLYEIANILKTGKKLSLVIPDKRYTFDITRRNTFPSDIIGAYIDHHERATSASMFDYLSEYRKDISGLQVLQKPLYDFSKKPRRYSDAQAMKLTLINAEGEEYVDSHCHVFTPYSFFEIIKSLIENNLFDFEVEKFIDTPTNDVEFYVVLKKSLQKNKKEKLKSVPNIEPPQNIKTLKQELTNIQKQLNASIEQNQKILNSKSWKTTKPMRLIISKAKNQKK
jgi:predicted SAM-dependent methyltransferase